MALNITPKDEPITVDAVKVLIYGQPGVGKTSIGFTAEAPLLLDTDAGSHRSEFRKDVVRVAEWQDIANFSVDDIANYKTIVVDTVGRLLDFLSADIIRQNPKMGFNGALSLQGYGQLKGIFASWAARLNTMGKDVVFIAHDKEDKKGDQAIVRPDIQGASYHEIFKLADAAGYLYRGEKGPVLDFEPRQEWIGKNVAHLEPINVPSFHQHPDFLAGVLQNIKDAINANSAEGAAIAEAVSTWREHIVGIEDADGLNGARAALAEKESLPKAAELQVKHLIMARSKELGIPFDKQADCFGEPPTLQVTPEEHAHAAGEPESAPEVTPEIRTALIDQLEQDASRGTANLKKEWEELTKAERAAIGNKELARLKKIATAAEKETA